MDFAHQVWASPAFGICVTLINKHGDAACFSTHATTFELTSQGRAAAEQLVAIFEQLNYAVARNLAGSLEDVCDYLAPRVHLDSAVLVPMLDKFLICDARYEEHMAEPCAYTLSVTDEHGTSHALFAGGLRYRRLNATHDSHLAQWA